MSSVDWSQLYKHRKNVASRFGDIWKIPLAKRYSDVLLSENNAPKHLLEVGAGNRSLKNKVIRRWADCQYASFDIDRKQFHDFYQLEEITGTYDVICMFEMIEHVSPQLAKEILSKCFDVLNPGGLVFVTTPNIFYPPGFLRDATHITPWCYDELGGMLEMTGLKVKKIYRLYKESILKTLLRRYLCYPLFRLLRVDFSKQIIIVAEKP